MPSVLTYTSLWIFQHFHGKPDSSLRRKVGNEVDTNAIYILKGGVYATFIFDLHKSS